MNSPISTGDITVFVVQHYEKELPKAFDDRNIYKPIQSGTELYGEIPGILHDNDGYGRNLSKHTVTLSELPAHYWVRRNARRLNVGYVGFVHHDEMLMWDKKYLAPDTILCAPLYCSSIIDQFVGCHPVHSEGLYKFIDEFNIVFPDKKERLNEYLNSNELFVGHFYIMHTSHFKRMWDTFMEPCVNIAIDLACSEGIAYPQHMFFRNGYAWVLERLTSYWIWEQEKYGGLTLARCPCGNV